MLHVRLGRLPFSGAFPLPFGLGVGELILALLILGVPIAVLLLGVKAISRALGSGRSPRAAENQQLAAELRQAQLRIEELEAKVAQVDEKATFAQELLERPRNGQ